jgi:hypothetical protein
VVAATLSSPSRTALAVGEIEPFFLKSSKGSSPLSSEGRKIGRTR